MQSSQQKIAPDPERPDDRFIPLASNHLVRLIENDHENFGRNREQIAEIASVLTRVLELEKSTFERLTTNSYTHFNPDRETVEIKGLTDADGITIRQMMSSLEHMLQKANFKQLSPHQVALAIKTANSHSMRVHLISGEIGELSVWVRGRSETEQWKKTLLHPRQGVPTMVPVFNRVVLLASPKDEDAVHIRLFKNIPVQELETLLPNAKASMSRRDAALMAGGIVGAVISLIFRLTVVSIAAAGQFLWVLMAALTGLSWRLFAGYRNAAKHRDSHRMHNLYYQNLGSNLSALHTIASMICEEEIKEGVLLYAFCTPEARRNFAFESLDQLDEKIESYLKHRLGLDIKFDIGDAVETLERLGLWEDRVNLLIVPPEQAITRLETHWLELRSEHYHGDLMGVSTGT